MYTIIDTLIEEIALDDYEPLKGLIPLVRSVSGLPLRQLRDSTAWVQRFAQVKKTAYASSDDESVTVPTASIPRQATMSPQPEVLGDSTPPTRPQKRSRCESGDIDRGRKQVIPGRVQSRLGSSNDFGGASLARSHNTDAERARIMGPRVTEYTQPSRASTSQVPMTRNVRAPVHGRMGSSRSSVHAQRRIPMRAPRARHHAYDFPSRFHGPQTTHEDYQGYGNDYGEDEEYEMGYEEYDGGQY